MTPSRPFAAAMFALAAAALAVAPAAAAHKKPAASRHKDAAHKKKHHPAAPAAKPEGQNSAAAAGAGPAKSLGTFGSWSAYVAGSGADKVCYVFGQPQKAEPAGVKRKQPMATVTHRQKEKVSNVVSFMAGYPLKEDKDAELEIGPAKFEMFTKDDSAWARTPEIDRSIVAALAKGRQAVFKAAPAKGPGTVDTYALSGFKDALAKIDAACGVKR